MDIISGNVTTTQEISGEVSPIKSVSGEATLLQATWTSISGKPFDSLDDSDFEVVDGVLKVIGGGGGGFTFQYGEINTKITVENDITFSNLHSNMVRLIRGIA